MCEPRVLPHFFCFWCSLFPPIPFLVQIWLEMEIGITGGEEDGVDNTGEDQTKLYTQPEQV